MLAPQGPAEAPSPPEARRVTALPGLWTPPVDGHGLYKSLVLRLPLEVRRSLDHEQLMALRQATEELAWHGHAVDIRLSFWTPLGRRYLAIVGGRERRGRTRLAHERARHPLVRLGNLVSLLLFGCIVLGLGGFAGLAVLAIAYL